VIATLIILTIGYIFYYKSCNKDFITYVNEIPRPQFSTNEFVANMKYDVEEITTTKVAPISGRSRVNSTNDYKSLSNTEQVLLIPKSSRTAVETRVREDGSTEILIEILEPSQKFEAKSYAPPDNTPKVKKIFIANNQATAFDEKENPIHSFSMDVNNMVRSLKEKIAEEQKNTDTNAKSTNKLNNTLIKFINNGAKVFAVGKGMYKIEQTIGKDKQKTITTIDATSGKTLHTAIFDKAGNIKLGTINIYANKNDKSVLSSSIQHAYFTTNSGVRLINQTISKYNKFEVSGNFCNCN
ncbi:MAG: hypothetical protein ORN58_03730, partial [Sediminibacterium sp.]|nr:hypothetical protein [Sediminibacterium sp.]